MRGPAIMLSDVMHIEQSVPRGLLPLVVGVTGHRDLAADEVRNAVQRVRDLFRSLKRSYPHTPIVLLSSLAEGADRLVARTALECGAQLYVVLPLQSELYERDFASPQSLQEFRALMARSSGCGVVPTADDRHTRAARIPGPARDLRYAAAGAFVVSHSEILIALWDGNEDESLGGTSQIVRFALQGVPTTYLGGPREALRANETGAVHHITVRRESAKPTGNVAAPAQWRYPEVGNSDTAAVRAAQAAFLENLRNLERFNRDAVMGSIDRQLAVSAGYLLTAQQEASLNLPGMLSYTRALFAQADALALRCRNWTHVSTIAIFSAIGVAAVLFSLYTNVLTGDAALYFAFLGLVAGAFGIDLTILSKRMQDRFQDYRALAEGLRVQFYWRLAGIRESVYDHYFARQEGELDWIRNAMRAERFRRQAEPTGDMSQESMQALLAVVLVQWINGEGAYFSRAVRREREFATRIKWGANACLILTGCAAIALAVTVAEHQFAYHGLLVAFLTLALAGAGLFTGYAQKRAHQEHARRYRRMAALYDVAGKRVALLLRERDLEAARGVLLQLGREALAETCDWLLLHRERQIDVPTG
ncbi:MAG TPA: hypothetical protein VIX60_04645 [Candidatus Cybelea sp.]